MTTPKATAAHPLGASAGSAKPCDLPCPKCGATDIYREHRVKGESVDKSEIHDECKPKPPYLKGNWPWGWKVTKEHISHHCRTCHYAWRTDIIAEQ